MTISSTCLALINVSVDGDCKPSNLHDSSLLPVPTLPGLKAVGRTTDGHGVKAVEWKLDRTTKKRYLLTASVKSFLYRRCVINSY